MWQTCPVDWFSGKIGQGMTGSMPSSTHGPFNCGPDMSPFFPTKICVGPLGPARHRGHRAAEMKERVGGAGEKRKGMW